MKSWKTPILLLILLAIVAALVAYRQGFFSAQLTPKVMPVTVVLAQAQPGPVVQGVPVRYEITVRNTSGTDAIQDLSVAVPVPKEFVFTKDGTGWNCSQQWSDVICGPVNFAPGKTTTYSVAFVLAANAACTGSVALHAAVQAKGMVPVVTAPFTSRLTCRDRGAVPQAVHPAAQPSSGSTSWVSCPSSKAYTCTRVMAGTTCAGVSLNCRSGEGLVCDTPCGTDTCQGSCCACILLGQ